MNSDYEREKRALCNGSFTFTSSQMGYMGPMPEKTEKEKIQKD